MRPDRQVWVALESQFRGNRETQALHLDAAFRSITQGDLSVTEYCCQLKKMADDLHALGEPISDCTLVLNLLRGLNERFSHLRPLIVRTVPFPAFQQVKDDLLLEEITQGAARDSTTATAFYSSGTSHPRPSMPSAPTPPPLSGPSGSWGTVVATAGVVAVVVRVMAGVAGVAAEAEVLRGRRSTTHGPARSPCGLVRHRLLLRHNRLRLSRASSLSAALVSCLVQLHPWCQLILCALRRRHWPRGLGDGIRRRLLVISAQRP
jgi:hypothetical protein